MNLLNISFGLGPTVSVVCALALLAAFDLTRRIKHPTVHLLFAAGLGSVLSFGLMLTVHMLVDPSMAGRPHALTLLVVVAAIFWRCFFGPWNAPTKATILGTLLFWICLNLLSTDDPENRNARIFAAVTALFPAIAWCWLFLKYHRERMSVVLLMFFGGMLSTAPILFYDALVRRGIELQFFLVRITPQNFTQVAHNFAVRHSVAPGVGRLLLGTLVSFLIVGFIEECTKMWVMMRSGKAFVRNVDDVMQLSIIVAIGFSFAENVVNPVYFTGFVHDFLMRAAAPDIGGFLGNVLGRSIVTTMVHIVSTGFLGYSLGLCIFAESYLADRRARRATYPVLRAVSAFLELPEILVFRIRTAAIGLLCAIVLHGVFNFLVTLPELLPGNPTSLPAVLGLGENHFLQRVPFLLIPAMLYVAGGFWMLTTLFMRVEDRKEQPTDIRD